ncbi:MAG: hypothetical protein DLM62_06300 [Pseudonocardiales bacterium]|nr:MAG: hypothetical protein DLM62_06300 [Pseudonocardiales bacterium]
MSVRQLIPQDLASIAPGPELACVLADLELSRLSGFDCVEVLKAQYRQANHERARVMAAMVEVGMCGVGPAGDELRRMPPDEFSPDEIRAALMLTRRAADTQFWLAHDLLTRLPQVHAAMDVGELDEPRARVFSDWTTELSDDQARVVCATLLPGRRSSPPDNSSNKSRNSPLSSIPTGPDAATNRPSPNVKSSATEMLTDQRTSPATICPWTGSPRPVDTSTHSPGTSNALAMPDRSTTSAPTCSSA